MGPVCHVCRQKKDGRDRLNRLTLGGGDSIFAKFAKERRVTKNIDD